MRPPYQEKEKWLFYLMSRKQHRVRRKMKKQRKMFPNKKIRIPKQDVNEIEIVIYLTESKIRVIKVIIKVRRTMHE